MKTPISYYGGKQTMVNTIVPMFPNHHTYVEPFFGGGAIFFAKEPSKVEIINDINKEAVNFYKAVKYDFNTLKHEVDSTLQSRDTFRQAKIVYENPDMFSDTKRAWAFYTCCNYSFSCNMSSWGYDRDNTMIKKVNNKKVNFNWSYVERLENTTVECNDANKVIKAHDSEKTFFYCDPPYYNSVCGPYDGYTEAHYEALLNTLSAVKGKFLLSSYPSPILSKYTKANGWNQTSIDKKIAVSPTAKKVKTEVLTYNYIITK